LELIVKRGLRVTRFAREQQQADGVINCCAKYNITKIKKSLKRESKQESGAISLKIDSRTSRGTIR
jgi:hypothetical protein